MNVQPKLRPDLVPHLHDESGGKKRIFLRDPVSEKYFRLSEYEHRFLAALDGVSTIEQVVERLRKEGRHYTVETAGAIIDRAGRLGLLLGVKHGSAAFLKQAKAQARKAKRVKALSSVYYLFIPVLNPDRFLSRTLPFFKIVANKWTTYLVAAALPGALYLVVSGIPKMQLEYLFFFNWRNLMILWFTIALTKLIHEFSHAYVAKSYGLRVPEMGVAFLIFFPCLYCNTTDAWRLADRRQRAAISSAGIISEAAMAVLATYVWHFSKPGLLNSLAFYLMGVSFVSTVLFNGNPLLKFDGYFILTDYLGMPNLASNSSKYLKYLALNRTLGYAAAQNPSTSPREAWIFGVYGVAAFIYRIFLYAGIVLAVYYRFDKLLGLVLALIAFGLFVARPLALGVVFMVKNRHGLRPRLKGLAVVAALVAAIAVPLCAPWSSKSVYPCYVGSAKIQKLTAPIHTFVSQVFVRDGSEVRQGEELFKLDMTELAMRLRQKEIDLEGIEKELQYLLLDSENLYKAEAKEIERRQAEDEIAFLLEQRKLALGNNTAPFDGVVTNLDFRFQEGFQPGEGAVVGEVRSIRDLVIQGLVPAEDVHKISKGESVEVWLPLGEGLILREKVEKIKPYSETDLSSSPFSSRLGGEVATEIKGRDRKEVPIEAYYVCSIRVASLGGSIPLGMTGRMAVASPRRSVLSKLVEDMARTFNREAFF